MLAAPSAGSGPAQLGAPSLSLSFSFSRGLSKAWCGAQWERAVRSPVSQLLRYFSSSCVSGDKGLPSHFPGPGRGERLPPVWARVPQGFSSMQISLFFSETPYGVPIGNLLRELSGPHFVSGPHPTCWRQQPRPSRTELPEGGSQVEGEGGQGSGRGGGAGHSEDQGLRAQDFPGAGWTSGGDGGHVPSPPGPPSPLGRMPEGLPLERFFIFRPISI